MGRGTTTCRRGTERFVLIAALGVVGAGCTNLPGSSDGGKPAPRCVVSTATMPGPLLGWSPQPDRHFHVISPDGVAGPGHAMGERDDAPRAFLPDRDIVIGWGNGELHVVHASDGREERMLHLDGYIQTESVLMRGSDRIVTFHRPAEGATSADFVAAVWAMDARGTVTLESTIPYGGGAVGTYDAFVLDSGRVVFRTGSGLFDPNGDPGRLRRIMLLDIDARSVAELYRPSDDIVLRSFQVHADPLYLLVLTADNGATDVAGRRITAIDVQSGTQVVESAAEMATLLVPEMGPLRGDQPLFVADATGTLRSWMPWRGEGLSEPWPGSYLAYVFGDAVVFPLSGTNGEEISVLRLSTRETVMRFHQREVGFGEAFVPIQPRFLSDDGRILMFLWGMTAVGGVATAEGCYWQVYGNNHAAINYVAPESSEPYSLYFIDVDNVYKRAPNWPEDDRYMRFYGPGWITVYD